MSYTENVRRGARTVGRVGLGIGGCATLAVLCFLGCCGVGLVASSLDGGSRSAAIPAPAEAAKPAPTTEAPTVAARRATAEEPSPPYRVLREVPTESALKAQVDGRLLVAASLSDDELRAVLVGYLSRARDRRGWQRHARTTRVYAYAYASASDANGSGAGWVAQLVWSETNDGADPLITIDATRLEAARRPAERFGLPEARRREIHRALWSADLASAQAGRSDDDENAHRVARRFGVSVDTVRAIGLEGIARRW